MTETPWKPTIILRDIESFPSSTCVARVRTDAGNAFVKALGAPEGTRPLVSEFLGTIMAGYLQLRTFDFVIHDLRPQEVFKFPDGRDCSPGPCFMAREADGTPWDGTEDSVNGTENSSDAALIILLDTWCKNVDRYFVRGGVVYSRPDNLFLENTEHGKTYLLAMDHSHCLLSGNCHDLQVYGGFPEFSSRFNSVRLQEGLILLGRLAESQVQDWIDRLPEEWISVAGRDELLDFVLGRADFLSRISPDHFLPASAI